MADVIIKGMEMPKNCYSCHLRKRNGMEMICPVLRKSFSVADVNILHYRLKDCPCSPAPEWHDVADPPKRDGSYYATRHSAYGDFQTLLDYSATDDSWFEYDADYGDDFGILEHDDVVRWHDLPEPPEGGGRDDN